MFFLLKKSFLRKTNLNYAHFSLKREETDLVDKVSITSLTLITSTEPRRRKNNYDVDPSTKGLITFSEQINGYHVHTSRRSWLCTRRDT